MNIRKDAIFLKVGTGESDGAETTEASSSFSNTESETEYGFDGDEADSALPRAQNPEVDFDSCYNILRTRNKKLTSHWRKFVRPLTWRCKWMELRMKELELQALQYDKELAEYDEESRIRMNKLMKKHKRKRIEDTVDTKSYMSRHNLFSYYENDKFFSDGDVLEDDAGNPGTSTGNNSEVGTNEGFSFESRDEERCFEDLFRNIETVQSQVRKLITRVDVVVYTHAEKVKSLERFSNAITRNVLAHSARNRIPSQNACVIKLGDESTGRSVPSLPQVDIAGKRLQSQDVLIDNKLAKEELQDFENFRVQFGRKSVASKERIENPTLVPEADSLPSQASSVRAKGTKRKRRTKRGSRKI